MGKSANKRIQIRASITQETFQWLTDKIKDGTFYNMSHAIEFCVYQEMVKKPNNL